MGLRNQPRVPHLPINDHNTVMIHIRKHTLYGVRNRYKVGRQVAPLRNAPMNGGPGDWVVVWPEAEAEISPVDLVRTVDSGNLITVEGGMRIGCHAKLSEVRRAPRSCSAAARLWERRVPQQYGPRCWGRSHSQRQQQRHERHVNPLSQLHLCW